MASPEAPQELSLLEPVSELIAAKPELYEKLLGGQALENVILGEN